MLLLLQSKEEDDHYNDGGEKQDLTLLDAAHKERQKEDA